ncbi:MAG TPA: hypothetical protein VKA21_05280 [Candidatus Binatia bacterium]|nr:hypothetical protein [Candidatus Binatia bacterium]
MRPIAWLVGLVLLPAVAAAYQADLVPATRRIEGRDIEGSVSIGGGDGTVRIRIEGVNDVRGEFLDNRLTVTLRLRVNGFRRRVTIPIALDAGDGEETYSLGLKLDDQVVVQDVRVRGPDRRTLAQAGVVTSDVAPAPAPPPPPTAECPDALASCESDLVDCTEELDACELL